MYSSSLEEELDWSESRHGMRESMKGVRGEAAGAKGRWGGGTGVSGVCFLYRPVRSKVDCTVAETASAAVPNKNLSIVPPARGRGVSFILTA